MTKEQQEKIFNHITDDYHKIEKALHKFYREIEDILEEEDSLYPEGMKDKMWKELYKTDEFSHLMLDYNGATQRLYMILPKPNGKDDFNVDNGNELVLAEGKKESEEPELDKEAVIEKESKPEEKSKGKYWG